MSERNVRVMSRSKLRKNVAVGIGGQILVMLLGFVLPRVMIAGYGSDVNGLLGTISQIFSYMALLEAGVGQAAKNALYQPIVKSDQSGISLILSISRNYFRKLTVYYGAGVVLLAATAPFVLNTEVTADVIAAVVLLEGMSGVLSFFFVQTISTMLVADGRSYINNAIIVTDKILCYAVRIIMAGCGVNIVLLQTAYFLITVAKVAFYYIYFRKEYAWVNLHAASGHEKLKDRNAYIITEVAWTLFSSTDMIVLSVFVNTKMSSVYYVYNMVFSGLNMLLNAVYSSINYLLGQTYHSDLKKYEKMHDAFMSVFVGGMTVLVSAAYILCVPFIKLYTHGVTDIDYVYEAVPLLFCLVQLISWSRYIGGNLTGIAGYAKKTSYISMAEATVNILLSLILVGRFGIVGVLVATVAALPLKVLWCIYISDKKVMHRSYKKTAAILGINYLLFVIVVVCGKLLSLNINNYGQFALYAVIVTILLTIIGSGLNFIVNPCCLQIFLKLLKKGK